VIRLGQEPEEAVNDQHMYDLSTPTLPDHLADITAGQRSPARLTPESNLAAYEKLVEEALTPVDELKQAVVLVRPEYIAGSRTDPYGMRFPWGPIIEMHQIGPYTILEFLEDTSNYDNPSAWERHGRTLWHVYIDGKNTGVAALSLDAALAGAIAYRRDGADSTAGDYFIRMVGGGD